MSHFTKNSQANIIDKAAFMAACRELGSTDVREKCVIKDYYKDNMTVDAAARFGDTDVGLVKAETGKGYNMVSDWWGIRTTENRNVSRPAALSKALNGDLSDQNIQNCLLKYTTKHTIVNKYKKQGFSAKVTNGTKGELKVSLTHL